MDIFENPFAVLGTAFGKIHAKLQGNLAAIESVKPSAGTVHELRKRNSYGLFSAVGLKGRVEGAYDRINLSTFLGAVGKQDIDIKTNSKPANSHQALPLVDRKWNLKLQPASIVSLPITYDGDGIGTVTIRGVEGALDVYGQFVFRIIPGADNIAELNLSTNLNNALYPNNNPAKGQASFLSYPADTTPHNAYLSSVWTNQPIDQAMIDVIDALTGVSWGTAPGEYSLSGAQVSYAGVVRSGWDVPKTNFTRIVVITLGADCSNFAGELVFYHNPN